MKKISVIALSLLLTSACSLGGLQKIEVLDNIKPSEVRVATNNEFKSLQSRGSVKSDEQLYVANLGKKDGGQFLVKFDFNTFRTKASVDGIPAKVASDVASVDVYLFKLPSNYNPSTVSGKNPFGVSNANLYWSKTGVTKNGSAINLLFTGVPGSTNHYYAGVVAKDINGNVISKDGYKWTGETDVYEGFNISSSGVGVNETSLEVSTTEALSIGVNLLDAVGAKIDTTVNLTSGSSALPSVSGSLYKVYRPKILFMLDNDIYSANYDLSNITKVTTNTTGYNFVLPVSSKDGSKIVFTGQDYTKFYILSINQDGSNQTQLTTSEKDQNPSFSPDGSKILFESDRDGYTEVYIMDINGSNQTNISNNINSNDYWPSFSPDGSKIAFISDRDGNGDEIYVMDADGSNQTRLTNNLTSDFNPKWSPDGSKIAFQSSRDGNDEIYVMNADGSNQTNISNNNISYDIYPEWSPDGSKIVFMSGRDSNTEIYLMDSDGNNQTRLTNNLTDDIYPKWSPDGSKIVFESQGVGTFIMDLDGNNQTKIE